MTDGPGWRAGTASAVITPGESLMLGGLWSRDGPATGTHRDLRAAALALDGGGPDPAVLVSLDLLFVPDGLRGALLERCALPPERLFVTATHTHSSPEVRPGRGIIEGWDRQYHDRLDRYLDELAGTVAGVVERSLDGLAPATVSLGRGRAGFAMNRREKRKGGYTIGANPDRPVDHDVPVLRVDGPDGEPAALAFGYACHPTTPGRDRYSPDWVGYTREALADPYPEATLLFLPGAAGDQSPFPRGRPALTERHGHALASAVEAGARANPRPLEGPLDAAFRTVDLPLEVPDRETLEDGLDADDAGVRGRSRYLLETYPDGVPDTYAYPVQRFDVDGLTLVGLAGEPVVAYADRLDADLEGTTWVAGCCHGYGGYVPTPRIIAEGGYEGGEWVENTPFPGTYEPLVEEHIVAAVTGLQ